jgi:hypothetical protein
MSIALEYQLVGFLSRCAAEWMDGSQSAMGCTLSAVLKWGWQRAICLKTHADNLCEYMNCEAKLALAKFGNFTCYLFCFRQTILLIWTSLC